MEKFGASLLTQPTSAVLQNPQIKMQLHGELKMMINRRRNNGVLLQHNSQWKRSLLGGALFRRKLTLED